MIRIQLFIGDATRPIKAWRLVENPDGTTKSPWSVAKEVADYIKDTLTEPVGITIVTEKPVNAQSYSKTLTAEYVTDNMLTLNGPIVREVMDCIQQVEGARDLVQDRINKGTY